jgi:hypothetical protein
MFERSDLVETTLETIEFRAGPTCAAPGDASLQAWTCRINRTRTRLSLAGVTLLELLGFAALTGNFALVLVAALRSQRRRVEGARL